MIFCSAQLLKLVGYLRELWGIIERRSDIYGVEGIGERFKKNYVKTITQIGTFILNHQESKYRIYGSVPESITKY